ncbi:MAG TPA: sigma-70 family RNA polymerase sigma factor [Myxococcaceae bacterium]|nr:sigma-70 family RNA polymerase sigma factor [Myxococcaceae bacterium]
MDDAVRRRRGGDETELVRRLREGDEQAFVTLVNAWHSRLLRVARGFVSTDAVAEEVVQDTWRALIERLEGFEGRSSLDTFLFRILLNRARTRGEREKRSVPLSSLEDEERSRPTEDMLRRRFDARGMWSAAPQPWEEENPERLAERKEIVRLIHAELENLPPGQRTVLVLRDIEGLDPEEVCSTLEITETNQRVLLHRARTRIRLALEEHLGR